MEESDIKKTAFREGSTSLYVFTQMQFGLSNIGSSFCHLIKQYLRDQQFVNFLLYFNDICIFPPTIDAMPDQIKLVFHRLKQFNLKTKLKSCYFWTSILFVGHVLLAKCISTNPEKDEKVKNCPVPKNIKEVPFLDWLHIIGVLSTILQERCHAIMNKWVQWSVKVRKVPKVNKEWTYY